MSAEQSLNDKIEAFYRRFGKLQVMVSPVDASENTCGRPVRTEAEQREFREMCAVIDQPTQLETDKRVREYCASKM